MSHRNARPTVHGRLLIVQRYQAGWKQAHIAAAMGVSRKCVKTWIDRYEAEGEAGLLDPVLAAPHHAHAHSHESRRTRSSRWRAVTAAGRRDRPKLGVSPRTVSRMLRRRRVSLPARVRPDDRARSSGPRSPPRSATNASGPASWCTWTSRSWAGSPTAAVGAPRRRIDTRHAPTGNRLRLRALPGRRPLPAGLHRDPARREGPTCAAFLHRAAGLLRSPRHHRSSGS